MVLLELYEQSVFRQAQKIVYDPTHILYSEFQLLPSGFVLMSIKSLNNRSCGMGQGVVQYVNMSLLLGSVYVYVEIVIWNCCCLQIMYVT